MKRGITCESKYDNAGNWMLVIRKKKGKLTMDEIREAAMEYEGDYYGLVLKCIEEDGLQYYDDDLNGDAAELYRMTDMLESFGRISCK